MLTQPTPGESISAPSQEASQPTSTTSFAAPTSKNADYTDGRALGEWESKYPETAKCCIRNEAFVLFFLLLIFCIGSGLLLSVSDQNIDIPVYYLGAPDDKNSGKSLIINIQLRLAMIFFVGCLGGTTFSIKWLVHAVAKCKWHLDRRYWRFFVPVIGGVYACVVLTLFEGGMLGTQSSTQPRATAVTAAFAFLVGYFSDGVSGLLSNIANAVFGTLEKK